MSGPRIVTDIVDVYVFRCTGTRVELLQLRRARPPYAGSWQPVMGRIDEGESPERSAVRELGEETGLAPGNAALLGLWRLDAVRPYYMAARGAIVMSVRFACEAGAGWSPTLNDEHDDARWVELGAAETSFMWPNQWATIRDIEACVLRPSSACRDALRVDPGDP